ncbi:MAG: hypothetical protein O6938_09815 [Gammaproteobacteria bacterium]|nr:hypothetical protein [Gammaproteobacteria bacterium]
MPAPEPVSIKIEASITSSGSAWWIPGRAWHDDMGGSELENSLFAPTY